MSSYRRTQRELRRHFEAFTRNNCATCPTPCCRRPARILPTDILLAEAVGWKNRLPVIEAAEPADALSFRDSSGVQGGVGAADRQSIDSVAEIAGRVMVTLHDPPPTAEAEPEALPCEYLGETGCTFPADLRPFGCTAYICRYMHERLDRPALTKIKRLVRELEENHRALMRTLHAPSRSRGQDT
jgi:hypothetical protein